MMAGRRRDEGRRNGRAEGHFPGSPAGTDRASGAARLPRLLAAGALAMALSSCAQTDINPIPAVLDIGSDNVVDGYTDRMSYVPGEVARVFVNALAKATGRLDLYNLNGEVVAKIDCSVGPQAIRNAAPFEAGFGYARSFDYRVPSLKSGIYLIADKVPLLVKQATRTADIVVVYPSNTANAYCLSGGNNFYQNALSARKLSFLRPLPVLNYALPFLQWMEKEWTKDVEYLCDADLDDYANIDGARLLVIPGHSEYWTREARVNFDRFVDGGGDALILSGNSVWWQVRYNLEGNQLICYKNAGEDPVADPLLKTINWSEGSLGYPIITSIGGDFDRGGFGLMEDKGWDGFKIVIPGSPLLEGTGLAKGDIMPCPSGEYDGAPLSGFDSDGYPVIDNSVLGFDKIEIIGFDYGYRKGDTVGTFIAFRKTPTSGRIVNVCSNGWCEAGFSLLSVLNIKIITRNALEKLSSGAEIFSP